MNADAIALLAVAIVIVWGGLVASVVFLIRRPEVAVWPPGDDNLSDEEIPSSLD
ncbi:MAG: methionine/alanine import family NSS transporter small subunit [Bifidobacteriaceae bacterium]|nr:methionine/alanine import family NSS transporter small subunit [Bifidobacteriaceae bacterium]